MMLNLIWLFLISSKFVEFSDGRYCVSCDSNPNQSDFNDCLDVKSNNETSYTRCRENDFCFTGFIFNTSSNQIDQMTRGCLSREDCEILHQCIKGHECVFCCDGGDYCNKMNPYSLLLRALSGKELVKFSTAINEYTVSYKKKYLAFVGLFILSVAFGIALLIFIFNRRPKPVDLEMKHEALTMRNNKLETNEKIYNNKTLERKKMLLPTVEEKNKDESLNGREEYLPAMN